MGFEKVKDRVFDFIMSKISQTKIPGLTVGVVEEYGGKKHVRSFGFRNMDSASFVDEKTLFCIGSITKSFTALSIMKLCEAGKLSLDDPVGKYLPVDLKVMGHDVKIHHLLTHSSGIPALAYGEEYIRSFLGVSDGGFHVTKPEDVLDFMRGYEEWVVSKPGEKFFYLNEGYVLLGLIISNASGMEYTEYVRREIFEPLEMERTRFCDEESLKDGNVSKHYVFDKNGKVVETRSLLGVTADGGIMSTTEDMLNYIEMYLNMGEFKGKKMVRRESLELMEKSHIKMNYGIFGDEHYGYGLMIFPNFLGMKLIGHGGSVLTHNTFFGYVRSKGIGVIVMQNIAGYSPMFISMFTLAESLEKNADELPFIEMEKIAKSLEGTYSTFKGTMKYSVRRTGDLLQLHYEDNYTERVIPLIPHEIHRIDEEKKIVKFLTFANGRKMEVEFHIDPGGRKPWFLFERYRFEKIA